MKYLDLVNVHIESALSNSILGIPMCRSKKLISNLGVQIGTELKGWWFISKTSIITVLSRHADLVAILNVAD